MLCLLGVQRGGATGSRSIRSIGCRNNWRGWNRTRNLLASAEACRQLQQCHALYNRAESLVKTWPSRALELHGQIIETAPPDSEIYRAAYERIRTIGSNQAGARQDKDKCRQEVLVRTVLAATSSNVQQVTASFRSSGIRGGPRDYCYRSMVTRGGALWP